MYIYIYKNFAFKLFELFGEYLQIFIVKHIIQASVAKLYWQYFAVVIL